MDQNGQWPPTPEESLKLLGYKKRTTLSIRGQFREIISLSDIISRYLTLQLFF